MKIANYFLIIIGTLMLPSALFAQSRAIHVEWDFPYNSNIAAFRLYHETTIVCETTDPTARFMDCTYDIPDGAAQFYMTTLLDDGTESEPSSALDYIFSSSLKAALILDSSNGESPLTVNFDASQSTGTITKYEWMFGDGDTATGEFANHIYTVEGNYTVTLTVTDTLGATDQETATIVVTSPVVANNPPKAVISSSSSVGNVPLEVQFDGTGSSDDDGTIISYNWDMGDGGTASGPQVTYTYATAGTFTATLTITDNGGLTDTISTPVIVNVAPNGGDNTPPEAIITTSKSSGYAPLTVSFNADKSYDSDGEITSYSWNFGDGSSSTGVSAKHTFYQPANYKVTLRITDNDGATTQVQRTITVKDSSNEPLHKQIFTPLWGVYHLLLGKAGTEDTEPQVQEE